MEEKGKDDVEEMRQQLENMVNVYGCRTKLNALAVSMTHMHRTLVQSFAGGFVIPFVREMAKMKRSGWYDARDAAAVEACEAMCAALEAKYGITEDDGLSFACV